MRWTSFACITIAIQTVASTAFAQDSVEQFYRGKTINIISARRCRRRLRQLCAARSAATWANTSPATRRSCRRTCRARAATRRPATSIRSRPRTAPPSARCFPAASWRRSSPTRRSSTIRRNSSSSAAPTATSIPASCASDSPIKSFKDTFTQEVIVGASNEGGTTRDMPTLSNNVLGTKFRIVTGYAGTREIALAVERKRDPRAVRLRLHQPALGDAALDGRQGRARHRAGERQGHAGAEQAGRAAHRRLRQDTGRPAGDGAGLQPGGVRPARIVLPEGVPPSAWRRCARRSWRRSPTRRCWPKPKR